MAMVLARIAVSLLLAAAAAAALAPASRQSPAIAPGVRIGPVSVGGLTSEPARAAVVEAFAQPVVVRHGDRTWTVDPSRFSVSAGVDAAVSRALRSRAGTAVPIEAHVSRAAVRTFVAKLARSLHEEPRDARFVGFDGKPVFRAARAGLAVREQAAVDAIVRAARSASGEAVEIPTRPVAAKRTVAGFGPLIVIDRYANRLRLYDGRKLVRTFGVATGQSVYPTPTGMWKIVDMQRNPWWYPPPSPWAEGEKPVPPGPGNPLGTRWMGLDAWGVGIHGTPNDASIGYSASHGCIRMHIPDAEWLFQHVDVGTPVLIR